ncbi:phage tail tube protein [Rhodococcoides fascians]|uniref:phage tail tube protein n=1 Tax=Rhodococcoides fascians TaxID=1828 RepID=UPI00050C45B1|nr:hypothetical protein [Rhodococcus fascians]
MVAFDSIADFKDDLVRKVLAGAVLDAPLTASLPATLTSGASSELVATTGFSSLGRISDAGLSASADTESSGVPGWGALEDVRTDIIRRTSTFGFACLETKKNVLALYTNQDLSAVTADATTGEVAFTEATKPDTRYRRMILLGIDGEGANAIYIARFLPRATISEVSEQSWSTEDALAYQMTVTAKIDSTLGYAVKHLYGGPGWKALNVKMGFATA